MLVALGSLGATGCGVIPSSTSSATTGPATVATTEPPSVAATDIATTSAPDTTTTTAAGPPSVTVSGNDPTGPACSALTTAQVERATGRRVVRIKGNNDHPSSAHRYTCSWQLEPTAECDCGYVMITATWHPNGGQIRDLVAYLDKGVAGGRLTAVPGVGEHAYVQKGTGLSSDVTAIQGAVDVVFAVRLARLDVPQNGDAAVALARPAMPLLKLQS